MLDDKELGSAIPGNPNYEANINRYIEEWKTLWGKYIPEMIKTKRVPDGASWGGFPSLDSSIVTQASQTYNVLVHSFTPATLKAIIFLPSSAMFEKEQGAYYGEQLSVLANSYKKLFGGEDPPFFYTIPSKDIASKITSPQQIKGRNTGVEINNWSDAGGIQKLVDQVIIKAYD
jgi:hypothetical protein